MDLNFDEFAPVKEAEKPAKAKGANRKAAVKSGFVSREVPIRQGDIQPRAGRSRAKNTVDMTYSVRAGRETIQRIKDIAGELGCSQARAFEMAVDALEDKTKQKKAAP